MSVVSLFSGAALSQYEVLQFVVGVFSHHHHNQSVSPIREGVSEGEREQCVIYLFTTHTRHTYIIHELLLVMTTIIIYNILIHLQRSVRDTLHPECFIFHLDLREREVKV